MKKQVVIAAIGTVMAVTNAGSASAESRWSLEFESPLWACLVECSGVATPDALPECLEACGKAHDSGRSSAQGISDLLRCKASLMRAEAAQFSCQSHCFCGGEVPGADLAGCIDGCNSRYARKADLVLGTARCEGMRDR